MLNTSDRRCCLGFYALARGINKKHIEDLDQPSDLIRVDNSFMLPELINLKTRDDNAICKRLMKINDNENSTDPHKEKYIKNNFKKLGVEVEFYG